MYSPANHLPDLPPLIEHVPGVVFRLSHEGNNWHTWFVTKNISRYGYTVEDFMSGGIQWLDLVHPDDRVLLMKTIADYEAHNINTSKLYYRLVTKSGEVVPVTEYNNVNRADDNSIICYDTVIVSNAQNQSNLRRIDSHYRQQVVLNDILLSLHDSNPEKAIQIILDRTGTYLDTSRALLFKDSPDHTTCKIVHEWCNQDISSVMALDNSITYETGMPEIYVALQTTGSLIINYGEIPENCKEEFDAEGLVASAIFAIYLKGEHYGFVCFDDCIVERIWDDDTIRFLKNIANLVSTVIARQEAALQLERNNNAFKAVLNNVDAYIFVADPEDGTIIFANRSFIDSFGEDSIGKKITSFIDVPRHAKSGAFAGTDSSRDNSSEVYCEANGEWLNITCEAIEWIDGNYARLFTCHNVTAKRHFAVTLEKKIEERTRELKLMTEEAEKAKAKAEEAMLAKSQFLANMSHEIRTPLNAILGLADLLARVDLDVTSLERVKNIQRSSALMLNVINDILDISKLEAGKLTLTPVNYSLQQTIDHLASIAAGLAKNKGISFRLNTPDISKLYLYGDDIRLRQILLNLLNNAIKFTQAGMVALEVELLDNEIQFYVRDTGIGIKNEDLQLIFEAFSQTDIHKNRQLQGTGLGLPISKNLVGLMGGTLKVSSIYGEGSVFTVTLPRVSGYEGSPEQEKAITRLDAPDATVLVVDDIEINLYVAEALLQEHGLSVDLAASGAEALQKVQQKDYDILFMDHMMPDMNGIEATLAIRNLGGKYMELPIIALTANVVSEARRQFEEAGMNDFLAKPIEAEKLKTILERWLPADKICDPSSNSIESI